VYITQNIFTINILQILFEYLLVQSIFNKIQGKIIDLYVRNVKHRLQWRDDEEYIL
jgi:hypothetical protein